MRVVTEGGAGARRAGDVSGLGDARHAGRHWGVRGEIARNGGGPGLFYVRAEISLQGTIGAKFGGATRLVFVT